MVQIRKIFLQYCSGWEKGSLEDILLPLHNDIYIKECYGPEYFGKPQVKAWAKKWLSESSHVSWKLKRIIKQGNTLASEWKFAFRKKDGTRREFDGASLVDFREGKIIRILEFWQTERT